MAKRGFRGERKRKRQ